MSIIQGNAHTSAGGGGYQIERSLRFNSADSAYLNRTPASAGNRKTWTLSWWMKVGTVTGEKGILGVGNVDGSEDVLHLSSQRLRIRFSSGSDNTPAPLLRDVSAWYHVVLSVDTTQATAKNRLRWYVNGTYWDLDSVGYFSDHNAFPTQNFDFRINNNQLHQLGNYPRTGDYFNGYMTEINFVDGQALTPSDFGETDTNTGVWKPKAFSGTYGTNGFYLKFADNSGTTSTTLGKDSSGNGNNWTPNNFSVTAGAGNDSLVDSPTSYGTDTGVGGEVRGNYATLNPLDKNTNVTINNGNLDAIYTGSADVYGCFSTFSVSSGKWYAEFTATSLGGSNYPLVGIRRSDNYIAAFIPETYVDLKAGTSTNRGSAGPTFAAFVDGDVLGIAFDKDSGKIFFSKNGTFLNSGNPVAGTGQFFSGLTDGPFKFGIGTFSSRTAIANFGQRAFAYTAPSGFKALCTQNLPTPTIGATSTTQANDYFNAVLYTGNGTAIGSGGLTISSLDFQPDFIWVKSRSAAYSHNLYDAVRGATKKLSADATTAENVQTEGVTAFNSNGFTVGNLANVNENTQTYVAWNWKANGAGSSNTAGTITSTVSANTTSGFSIVTASASGTSPVTVGHGLGVTPSLIIGKVRDVASTNWYVYSSTISAQDYLVLNSTAAKATSSNIWDTAPTSTVFTVGNPQNGWAGGNSGTKTYVFYCFSAVAGYSAFGSYTGNGSTDGPFVYLGFRPRYIMQKRTDSTGTWELYDTVRDTYNVMSADLAANLSDAETSIARFDSLSNGFKVRTTGAATNASGGTYIYAAFAETPAKFSLAR